MMADCPLPFPSWRSRVMRTLCAFGGALVLVFAAGCPEPVPPPPEATPAPVDELAQEVAAPPVAGEPEEFEQPWEPEPEPPGEPIEAYSLSAELAAEETPLETAAEDAPLADDAEPELGLEIYIFDLGQADSMLVIGPPPDRRTLLFDLGETNPDWRESSNYRKVARRIFKETGRARLDYLVVSHFHSDHIGGWGNGIAGLLDWTQDPAFHLDTLIDVGDEGSDYTKPYDQRPTYKALDQNARKWLEQGKLDRRIRPEFGDHQIDLGAGVSVEILAFAGRVHAGDAGALAEVAAAYPQQYTDNPANENDLSIAIEITYGDFELFTAGDLTGYRVGSDGLVRAFRTTDHGSTYTNVESRLLDRWQAEPKRESDVEIFCANHHGSAHSNLEGLFAALDPEFVVHSTGGAYDHPTRAVVERAGRTAKQLATTRVAYETWRDGFFTDQRGEVLHRDIVIEVTADGERYWINGEPHRAYADDEESSAGGDQDQGEEDR